MSSSVCASCGRTNRPGNRFCSGCGSSLAPRCPACGGEVEAGGSFCGGCGAPLAANARADSSARKVVSIVFADLIGSTALHERLDAESVRRFMDRYYDAMRAAVEAERGSVTQLLGDGVKAVFGVPRVAEDDSLRAVRAAVAMQQAFRELAQGEIGLVGRTGLRVAVNTGEVVASEEKEIIGDPVNVAARLQEEARDGDVVIGEATRRLVGELVTLAPLGAFAVKGRAERVAAWRVVSLERPARASATPFVGRESELQRLLAIHADAVESRRARLGVILGSPGLGKSRLIEEIARRLADQAQVLSARCDVAGGATFAPLAGALRAFLRLDDGAGGDALHAALEPMTSGEESERSRIAAGIAALLAGTPAAPEETFFVVRRFLAGLCAAQPVVLAIDDLQWAEPLLLDLVEHLVQWSDAPLLVLVGARPELRDARSSLATPGGLVAGVVTLAGLDAAAATRLAANAIGADELPAAVAGRVLTASEGNPLFVGELVRMLVQDGALVREGDRWTIGTELAALEMPPTIQALLAARIERLSPAERTLLERAAVVGRQFSRAAVSELLPREVADLDRHLESLRRSELIEPDTGWFLGEPALRFHHGLIRDAAYRRLLKEKRAELHERFADWVVRRAGDAAPHDETLGWHLEQAHQHLRELGPLDAHGRALGERAARYLGEAGRRALARDDVPLAAGLLGRALARLDEQDPARADLALDWCEALLSAGEVGAAAGAIDELGRFANSSPRLRAWHTCFAGQRAALTDPESLHATAEAVAAAAEALAAAGDTSGEAKGHLVHALALSRLGRVGACEAALDRALAAARRADDRRRSNSVLAGAPVAALWGPSPVTRASGRCLDVVRVLRITQGAPAVEAVALRCQGVLEALRGRSEAARRMVAASRRMVEELGITQRLLEADLFAGLIELIEGDALAAERCLRAAYEGLRAHGLGIDAAQAAALLGRALLAQGRAAEAEALSHESEKLAGHDLQAAIAWRGVRAESLAQRGEHAAAIDFASRAVELAAATDALLFHADARLALAAALRAAGRSAEADAEEARAISLWEAKGASLQAERARRETERVGPRQRPPEPSEPAHIEQLDPDREAEALARMDALIGGRPPRATSRRIPANAATSTVELVETAVANRDLDSIAAKTSAQFEVVDHITGARYDRQGSLVTWRGLFRSRESSCRHELLATLGESLALCRQWVFASGSSGQTFDVGPYEMEKIVLEEVDEHGLRRRNEVFAADRLGDAIVRLYERYAELLPEGPARTRAAATARALAAGTGPMNLERFEASWDADIEHVDHRTLGFGASRGRDAFLRTLRTLLEASPDVSSRSDDVLAARPDALLRRVTNFGTDLATGGRFERVYLMLSIYGADGRVARAEQFDPDREAEALARFDALTAEVPAPRPLRQRVRENAATASEALLGDAIAARDFDAIAAHLSELERVVDHQRGVSYDREGSLATFRGLLRARDAAYRSEPLATLGDSLALLRQRVSASGATGVSLDVGAYEMENIVLADADGARRRRTEIFAADRLGVAVVRLFERYAERLSAGPEWLRATATARAVAALLGPYDLARYATAFAPAIAYRDQRTMGFGSADGAEAVLRNLGSWLELAEDVGTRVDALLGLRADALLARWTTLGIDRATGGVFERPFCLLGSFGADGLMERLELFDADREAEALARFDALTAEAPAQRTLRRRVRENAATEFAARSLAAAAACDAKALASLHAENVRVVHHPAGVVLGHQQVLEWWRLGFADRDPVFAAEPLAALGRSLVLHRGSWSGSAGDDGVFAVGAFQSEAIHLIEVDAQGRAAHMELFASDRLGDAVVRMYERYAEQLPEGPAELRAAATAHSMAAVLGLLSFDHFAAALSPDVERIDHRGMALGSVRGAEALRVSLRAALELSERFAWRTEDILGSSPGALLVRANNVGTLKAGGGSYERPLLQLLVCGVDGRIQRIEWFDLEGEAEALARFDALVAEPAQPRFTNAATRSHDATLRCSRARDWEGILAAHTPDARLIDRRPLIGLDLAGSDFLASLRLIFEMGFSHLQSELLATRGERLALFRERAESANEATRGAVVEYLVIIEVDASGRTSLAIGFDLDDLDAAYAELDARYAAGEAAPYVRTWETHLRWGRALAARDWERVTAGLAPDVVVEDHRPLALHGRSPSRDDVVAGFRALVELRPDATLWSDHVFALSDRAFIAVVRWAGAESEGAFEISAVVAAECGPNGIIRRWHGYDLDQLDEARARLEELSRAERTPPRIENAATRAMDRFFAALDARDWDRVVAGAAPECRQIDRRAFMRLDLDRAQHLEWLRTGFERGPGGRISFEMLATRGDRLVLGRGCTVEEDESVGPSENVSLVVVEVNERGERVAVVLFDPDDLEAAYAELDARYAAGEGAPFAASDRMRPDPLRIPSNAATRARDRAFQAIAAGDWDALRALARDDCRFEDRGKRAQLALGIDAWIETFRFFRSEGGEGIREALGTTGDRIQIERVVWTRGPDGGEIEVEQILVTEVDEAERFRAIVRFDPDDRRAAFAEAHARFGAGEAAASEGQAPVVAFDRAIGGRDPEELRSCLAETFVHYDRRALGLLDTLDRDRWVESIQMMFELAPDTVVERLRILAWNDRGRAELVRIFGTRDGGAFENLLIRVFLTDRDRILQTEIFDAADAERALARFEELGAAAAKDRAE